MKLVITGCGSLGSWVAFSSVLRNHKEKGFDELILIDKDILELKNSPYLFSNLESKYYNSPYLGRPKVEVLKFIIENHLNPKITITSIDSIYQNSGDHPALNNTEDDVIYYYVDCRDTPDEDEWFDIKCNVDASYGKIILSPEMHQDSRRVDYLFENNPYYAMVFSTIICSNFIFSHKNQKLIGKRKMFIYDLTGGEVNSQNEQ